MCIRVYPLQEKELSVISTIGANDSADQNDHFSIVQFKIGDRFEFERFMIKVNDQLPENERLIESGPPIFRSLSNYRVYLNDGPSNQEWTRVEETRTRWIQNGIWNEKISFHNPSNQTVFLKIELEIDWNESHTKKQGVQEAIRTTVMWTDMTMRIHRIFPNYLVSETWLEWDRHAVVLEDGRKIRWQLEIAPGCDQSISLRTFLQQNSKLAPPNSSSDELNTLQERYQSWANQVTQIETDSGIFNQMLQHLIRKARAKLIDQQEQLIPFVPLWRLNAEHATNAFELAADLSLFDPRIAKDTLVNSPKWIAQVEKNEMWKNSLDQQNQLVDMHVAFLKLVSVNFEMGLDPAYVQAFNGLIERSVHVTIAAIKAGLERTGMSDLFSGDPRTMKYQQLLVRLIPTLARCGLIETVEMMLSSKQIRQVRFSPKMFKNIRMEEDFSDWELSDVAQMIGLQVDPLRRTISIRPELPQSIESVRIESLQLGDGWVSFEWRLKQMEGRQFLEVIELENSSGFAFVADKNAPTVQVGTK